MTFRIQQFVFGLAVVSTLAGCGEGPSGPPSDPNAFPFPQASIKSAGKDVAGAVVGLHTKEGSGPKIVGRYDGESGLYRFGTMEGDKEKPGVPEGSYTVTVAAGRGAKVAVPGKYATPKSSDLTMDVKKGNDAVIPLELK